MYALLFSLSSDPCIDRWYGVQYYSGEQFVKNTVLEDFGFTGAFDAASLSTLQLLHSISLKNNNLHGIIPEELGMCKALNILYLSENNFSGDLPLSFWISSNVPILLVMSMTIIFIFILLYFSPLDFPCTRYLHPVSSTMECLTNQQLPSSVYAFDLCLLEPGKKICNGPKD